MSFERRMLSQGSSVPSHNHHTTAESRDIRRPHRHGGLHVQFLMQFFRALQCTYCGKYKLAAISKRQPYNSGVLFAALSPKSDAPQVASNFEYVRDLCDVSLGDNSHRSCTKIAVSLHLQFSSRARARQKLLRNASKSI